MALTKTEKKHIGSFDDRLTFENWSEDSTDGMGGSSGSYSSVGTLWANVKPVGGRERIQMGAIDENISHIIQTRESEFDLSNETRITWNSRTLNVKYQINQGEDGAYYEYVAEEEQ